MGAEALARQRRSDFAQDADAEAETGDGEEWQEGGGEEDTDGGEKNADDTIMGCRGARAGLCEVACRSTSVVIRHPVDERHDGWAGSYGNSPAATIATDLRTRAKRQALSYSGECAHASGTATAGESHREHDEAVVAGTHTSRGRPDQMLDSLERRLEGAGARPGASSKSARVHQRPRKSRGRARAQWSRHRKNGEPARAAPFLTRPVRRRWRRSVGRRWKRRSGG